MEVASSLVRWLQAARHAAPSLPQQPNLIAPCHLQGAVETEANYKQVGPQQRGLSPSRCRAQQRSVGRLPLPRHPRGTRRTPQPPPTSAPCHPALAQVLVYALFVAAYIVALFLQASAYDTGEVVATLRGLLLPGARPRQPRAGAALLSAGIHTRARQRRWPPPTVRSSWRPTSPNAAPPAGPASLSLAVPALRRDKRRAGAAELGWEHEDGQRPAGVDYHPSHLLQQ